MTMHEAEFITEENLEKRVGVYVGLIDAIREMEAEDPDKNNPNYWDARNRPSLDELGLRVWGTTGRAILPSLRECALKCIELGA